MCQLLGLVFNQPVNPSFSFRGFQHRGRSNPHGWGLAGFPDGSAQIFKEPVQAEHSQLATFLRDYRAITSRIFVAHVRFGNVGGQTLANTHPFCREHRGRHVVFAHNGTLRTDPLRRNLDGRFLPVGQTDSELAFCSLLTRLSTNRIEFTNFPRIEAILQEMNSVGSMNLLFSEGEHLYVYFDQGGYNGLWFVEREAPHDRVTLLDEDWAVDLAEDKYPDQRGYVIATRPLTDERWMSFKRGTLTVFKGGTIIYPRTFTGVCHESRL